LSITQTGFEYDLFGREATIVVIDIDKDEHQKNTVRIDEFINTDVGFFLQKIINKVLPKPRDLWHSKCLKWKNKWPVYQGDYDSNNVIM
jgi:acetolactate synthase-1/2/3 large subunit